MINKIIKMIRLFPHPKKESYFAFYRILGFFPGNISYYEEALLHKSSAKEGSDGTYRNNERLEFLGDAVLDAIVADLVFQKFKNKREGFLTNTRSKIVKREMLDQVAKSIGLDALIVSSLRSASQKNHITGNALEALIGAIYLDKGYEKTHRFVEQRIINPYINIDLLAKKEVNFKSKLLEWTQKYRVSLDFILIENFTDGSNNSVFQSKVTLNGILSGTGTGYSKKESQQEAANVALKKIKSENEFVEKILSLSKKAVENGNENPDIEIINPAGEISTPNNETPDPGTESKSIATEC